MPAQEVESWLRSRRTVRVDGLDIRPRVHPALKGMPLSVSRGQAEAYFMVAADRTEWIVKKFHKGRSPDSPYLSAIGRLLPQLPCCASGRERRMVQATRVVDASSSIELVRWLDGTVMMPRVRGLDWATLADGIRNDQVRIELVNRAGLVRGLAQTVQALEAVGCSHRDLSSGNVLIDDKDDSLSLIDWDSLFHSMLLMPSNTTGGTSGYIAPFVWNRSGEVDAQATWQPMADRFALAVLCTEFLCLDKGSPLEGDGGMFSQDDLCKRRGKTIDAAQVALAARLPGAVDLFTRAMQADTFRHCSPPNEWISAAETVLGPQVSPPTLDSISWGDDMYLQLLAAQSPVGQVWPAAPPLPQLGELTVLASGAQMAPPAPRLADLPSVDLPKQSPATERPPINPPRLPDDPFEERPT